MLSILIPAYNYNVTHLVADLHHQAMENFIDFEIIVMEDGSQNFVPENSSISKLPNCKHIILTKNIGRSAIRNKLADEAIYDHLLFLDCDAEVSSSNFISKYLVFCKDENVVLGGRIYDQNNTDPQYSLIRKYGVMRERNDSHNLKNREKYPMFTTPNFLISRTVFNKIRFDESITGYGHEDTIFGIMLHKLNVEFIFIDNPVMHVGLENNEKFIQKTENAIRNLYSLHMSGKYPLLVNESKLLSAFLRIKKSGLTPLFAFKFNLTKKLLHRLLNQSNPSLLLYDLYKLLFLCKISLTK